MSTVNALRAFGRNDLAGIRRDSMLRVLVFAPLVYAGIVRFALPPLTAVLDERYGFDLVPYHPLILSQFLMLGPAAILGALAGLMLLDEKDTGTLHALRVTPVPLSTFAAYRIATLILVCTLFVVLSLALSGYVPAAQLPGAALAGLCSGLTAALVAVLMALVADNKVEGLAVVRAVGMIVFGLPVLPWFVPGGWELLFGVLPSYWPAKIFWVVAGGGTLWPWLLAGLAVNGLALALLMRAFSRRNT
ncbi:ABC transporter permease [Nocardiopsis aegyptia]|uniref:Fluoroquinolone transport system permease protein n=1 Tax=Nocardiopsis aegyptia TaxID=220378 RepID=A0A7Z0J8M0_9ACTN|nr:ABC transporter permease [Nocardiopsis aegyptia]NYJ32430.1 fluoroquinolone transport system permease protein [Nocardiopsis aegyptia]